MNIENEPVTPATELSNATAPEVLTKRFSPEQIETKTLRELSPAQEAAFYSWIESMTPEVDNEEGAGFAAWIREHREMAGDTCFVYFEKGTENIIATGSLIRKDRTVEADEGGWMMGGVNVQRDVRKQGIGTAIVKLIDDEIQARADATKADVPVKLFTNYEPAIKIYARLGYARFDAPEVENYTGGESEQQYRKDYKPSQDQTSLADAQMPAVN